MTSQNIYSGSQVVVTYALQVPGRNELLQSSLAAGGCFQDGELPVRSRKLCSVHAMGVYKLADRCVCR